MAIVVSYNAKVEINSVDLSDHVLQVTVNDGQESREVTAMGDTTKRFRAGLGTASIDCSFWSDVSSGSVNSTLLPLITMTTSGAFPVVVRKDKSTARSASNPDYGMTFAIIDGDVNFLDEKPGEVSQIKCRFLPYSAFTVTTTAT